MKITRAISIRQPYVEQILRGTKRWEFRSVNTALEGERVWIYASLRPADDPSAWRAVGRKPGELLVGGIVGSVVIAGSRKRGERDYAYKLQGPRRCRLKNPKNHPQPIFWRPKF